MQRVTDLSEELGMPGTTKLWLEVWKRKIPVSRTQVNQFVQRQAERQVFTQPLPRSEGKIASEDVDVRYMIDVVNFRGDLLGLFLINVFTRKVWTVAIKDKTAGSVLSAGRALISRLPEPPKVVSSDDGLEYTQLSDYLKEKTLGTSNPLLTPIKTHWPCSIGLCKTSRLGFLVF